MRQLTIWMTVLLILTACSLDGSPSGVFSSNPTNAPITSLSPQRPQDFAIHVDDPDRRFSIIGDRCEYRYFSIIAGTSDTPSKKLLVEYLNCSLSSEELDTLYQQVRASHFDQIGPQKENQTCRNDFASIPWIDVTAYGKTYAPVANTTLCNDITGINDYIWLYQQLQELKTKKLFDPPTDLLIRYDTTFLVDSALATFFERIQDKICLYHQVTVREPHYSGKMVKFCPGVSAGEQKRIIRELENVPGVKSLDQRLSCQLEGGLTTCMRWTKEPL